MFFQFEIKSCFRSLLTGLFAPTNGTIEVYGMDMQSSIDDVRKEMGVCMQYDVLFDHLTTKEHLLLYAQIKAPTGPNRKWTNKCEGKFQYSSYSMFYVVL